MQKKLLLRIILFSFLFFPIGVNAAVLQATSNENGIVNLSIESKEGFVRGYEIQISIHGDIWWDSINFSSSLPTKSMKEYRYNPNTKMLTIFVAGTQTDNLVSSFGKIELGSIVLKGSNSITYQIQMMSLKTTNMDYQTVNDLNIDLNDIKKFNYQIVNQPDEKPEEPKPSPDIPSTNTPKPDDKTEIENGNSNNNNGNNSSNNNENETPIEKPETPEESEKEEPKPTLKEEKMLKKESTFKYILVVGILILSIIFLGIILYMNRKKK